jgi:hypothetical protein
MIESPIQFPSALKISISHYVRDLQDLGMISRSSFLAKARRL